MVTINKRLAAFVLWFAVVAFASPSFAQQGENHMSDARAKAIHECNIRTARYTIYLGRHRDHHVSDLYG